MDANTTSGAIDALVFIGVWAAIIAGIVGLVRMFKGRK